MLSALREEFIKIPRLVQRGICQSYILITNARLTGNSEEAICAELRRVGVLHPVVLGGQWVNQTIAAHRSLRMLVPRVYGLGDLSQILDDRSYVQSQAFLNYLSGDLATFVTTDSYLQAAEAMRDQGFVLLLGEPAVGKSAIAASLAAAAIDNWGCSVVVVHDAKELLDHWNPHEPNQFFWVDDAFGSVRHERTMTDDWCRRLPKVMAAVDAGARIALTSRDYIYKDARKYLKEYAFPLLRESRIVVNVEDLNLGERRQMIYNHLRCGDQSPSFLRYIKPYLDAAAEVDPFRPEIARRLGAKRFTRSLGLTRRGVVDFMAKPRMFLRDVYAGMSAEHIGALSLVYIAVDLPSPLNLTEVQLEILERIGCARSEVVQSLSNLNGTFLRHGSRESGAGAEYWSFRHPTLREGFAALIGENPDLLDILLEGLCDVDDLAQLDASESTSTGTLVRVPPSRYPRLVEKISGISSAIDDTAAWGRYCRFLAYRCSGNFLSLYMAAEPDIVQKLMVFGPTLAFSPEVDVLAKLRAEGLLEEGARMRALRRIKEFTVEFPDASWFNSADFRILMDPPELMAIFCAVESQLIPRLDEILIEWASRLPEGADKSEYYLPLTESLFSLQQVLLSNDSAVLALERALRKVDDESGTSLKGRIGRSAYWAAPVKANQIVGGGRSVFEDIDLE